jgi:phage head maturation protease
MAVCGSVRHFSFSFSSKTDAMSWCQSSETTLRHPRESQLAVVERGMRR